MRKHIEMTVGKPELYKIEQAKDFKKLLMTIFGNNENEATEALSKFGITKGTEASKAAYRAFYAYYNWKGGKPPAGTLYKQTKNLFVEALRELRNVKGFAPIVDGVLTRSQSLTRLVWAGARGATKYLVEASGEMLSKAGKGIGGRILIIAGILWSIKKSEEANEAVQAIDKEILSTEQVLKKGKPESELELQRKLYELRIQRQDLQEWADIAKAEITVPVWPTLIKMSEDQRKAHIAEAQEYMDSILEIANSARLEACAVAQDAIEALRYEHWAIRYGNVKREANAVGMYLAGVMIEDILAYAVKQYGNNVAKWPKTFPNIKDFGLNISVIVCGFKDELKDTWPGTKLLYTDPDNKFVVYLLDGKSSQAAVILSTWRTTVLDIAAIEDALVRDKEKRVTGLGKISFPKGSQYGTQWAVPKGYKWLEIEIRKEGAKEWVWEFELSPYRFVEKPNADPNKVVYGEPVEAILNLYRAELKSWNQWLREQIAWWNDGALVGHRLYEIFRKDPQRATLHVEIKDDDSLSPVLQIKWKGDDAK